MSNLDEATPLSTLDPALVFPEPPQAKPRVLTPDANHPVWGIGGALLVWIGSIALVVFVPVLFLIPYLMSSGPSSMPALVEFATKDKTAILLQLISIIPCHVITFLMVWALVTRFGKQSFRAAIGLEWPAQMPWWLGLMLSIVLGGALFIVGTLIAKLLGADKSTQLEQIINSSLAARYTIAFLAVFTAPFVEEFIYRGVLYAALQKTIGIRGAVVVVLLIFTVIHVPQYWPNAGVIAAVALLSIALTLVRAFSGRLLPCVVIHFAFNGIQAVLLILEPYLHNLYPTPEQVPPTAGLLLSLLHLRF